MNKEQFRERYGVYPLRQWTFPKTRPYNGFTPYERIRGWQLTMWFIDNGWLEKPARCSITGETGNIIYHNEYYYTPWAPHAISRVAHSALHQRFVKPGWWRWIMTANAKTGEEWLCQLSMDAAFGPAANIRAKAEDDVRDVFTRAPIPDPVHVPWH